MRRLFQILLLAPIVILGLAVAVANRHDVAVSFDPFQGANDAEIKAPLFLLLILALMCGVLIGGVAMWFTQGRHRRALRHAREEAARWRNQAEALQSSSPPSEETFSSSQKRASQAASGRLLLHS